MRRYSLSSPTTSTSQNNIGHVQASPRIKEGLRMISVIGVLLFLPASLLFATNNVQVTYSSFNNTDTNNQLTAKTSIVLVPVDSSSSNGVIVVNPTVTFQTWEGFGGSLEQDSIWELGRLTPTDKAVVLDKLFNPSSGNAYNSMRLAIGSADFAPSYNASILPDKGYWTYDDMPAGQTDPTLANFSIQRDVNDGVFTTLTQILAINPRVRFFASAWSPPAWMKSNGTLIDGGHVLSQYYQALANYYVKYIQAYQERGVPIYAVTVQNEPSISVGYPSTLWTTSEYLAFTKILGQTFAANNLKTKIWGLDDNQQNAFDYANVLADSESSGYVDGLGFHNYSDNLIHESTSLRQMYPGKTMHITEITNGAAKLVDYFRNWISSYAYWLTFIEFVSPGPGPGFWQDTYRDPATDPDFWVDSQVSWAGTPGASSFKLNAWYYTFGQFSRFIHPGAIRLASSATVAGDVSNVAFRNPDGTVVLVVVNRQWNNKNAVDMNTSSKTIKVVTPDGQFSDTIPGDTVATYVYSPITGKALSKAGWTVSATNTYGSYNAIQAIDRNRETQWTSGQNQVSQQAFSVNFGSAVTFDRISLDMGLLQDDSPYQYQIFSSTDGQTWGTALVSGSGTSYVTNATFAQQTKQYLKVVLTASAARWWSISELSVFSSLSGLFSSNGFAASASGSGGSDVPARAIDGDMSTRWTSGSAQSSGQWFQVDLTTQRTFNLIELDSGTSGSDYPRSYSVTVSNDGSTWSSPVVTGAGYGQKVRISMAAQTARYVKIAQLGTSQNWWSIAELRISNQAPQLLDRTGWVITSSGSGAGSTTANALDGNLASRWTPGAAQAPGQYIQVDLSRLDAVSGLALNAGSFTGDSPAGYLVSTSVDGVHFNDVAAGMIVGQDNLISFPQVFSRYIKVALTATKSTNYWSVAEINVLGGETLSVPVPVRLSNVGWTATASTTESGGSPSVAVDGKLQGPRSAPYSEGVNYSGSRWTSGVSQVGNSWFQVDLGSAKTFNVLEINSAGSPSDYGRGLKVYVSNDGATWTQVAASDETGPTQRIKFGTVSARFVNVNQTGTAQNWWSIAELALALE